MLRTGLGCPVNSEYLIPVAVYSSTLYVNLYAPCVLYTGKAFRYSPEKAFYIFNQQIYFII